MCNRTVTLTVKSKDLEKILRSLDLSKEFMENTTLTLTVDIEDTKKNYQVLCGSPEILEWDFFQDKDEEEKPIESSKGSIEDIVKSVRDGLREKISGDNLQTSNEAVLKETKDLVRNYIKTYDDIIEFILLSWRLSKRFSEYSVELVKNYIIPGIIKNQTDISEVVSLDKKIVFLVTSYYSGVTTEKIMDDVIGKVRDLWEILSETPDIDSLVEVLFKPIDL